MASRHPKKLNMSGLLRPPPGGARSRALGKVGKTSVARLAWLVHLLNRNPADFASPSEKDVEELEAQVEVFCDAIGSVAGGKQSRLSVDQLVHLIDAIKDQVLGLLKGETFELHIPGLQFVATAAPGCRYMGSVDALFTLAVAKLIEHEKSRIRTCGRPGCDRLFVRRKRAIYCSRQCAQIETFKRYVARHSGEGLQ